MRELQFTRPDESPLSTLGGGLGSLPEDADEAEVLRHLVRDYEIYEQALRLNDRVRAPLFLGACLGLICRLSKSHPQYQTWKSKVYAEVETRGYLKQDA